MSPTILPARTAASQAVPFGGDAPVEVVEGPAQRLGLTPQRARLGQFGAVVGQRGPGGVGVNRLKFGGQLRPPFEQRCQVRWTAAEQTHALTLPAMGGPGSGER